jgi:hypothetical protein
MKTQTFHNILEEARKSPRYKSARLTIQFWEIVLTTLKEKNMTVGQLARKMKIPVAVLKLEMAQESKFLSLVTIGEIAAALEIDLRISKET